MTEEALDRIETALRIALPGRYREFARRLPETPDDEDAHKWYPFIDADDLIRRNQELRSGDILEGWRPELFCIGTFEGGDFFVDLSDLDKGIFLDHSTSGDDHWGGLYNPDDYSGCHISTFEEFINR